MGIFGNIMEKIFGSSPANAASPPTGASQTSAASVAASGTAAPAGTVDVTNMLDDLAAKAGQRLNWRESIVDLMKLLDLDSSLAARKELAKELNYSGDTN